jgi:hypothetical protein
MIVEGLGSGRITVIVTDGGRGWVLGLKIIDDLLALILGGGVSIPKIVQGKPPGNAA